MKVSVVICTYAEDMYDDFCEAVESLYSQTYDDLEVVIIIDGTEAVAERVEADYGDRDDVVIHLNDENVGLLESRNRGAELAGGDIVAFIDDDAVADDQWIEELVQSYEEQDALAVGGKMTPDWVVGQPDFLPEEFYWLVGATHRGFADGPGWVRNTFGSNISFRRDIFLELDGFDTAIGGRKGDKNLQGGETELCARMASEYDERVWYNPDAEVAHKVFDYRTDPMWLLDRAFWQGYSKRAMDILLPETGSEENEYLNQLIFDSVPRRLRGLLAEPAVSKAKQLGFLILCTTLVGCGYLYAFTRYREGDP